MKNTSERAWQVVKLLEAAGVVNDLAGEDRYRTYCILNRLLSRYANEVVARERQRIASAFDRRWAEYRAVGEAPPTSPLTHLLQKSLREIIQGGANVPALPTRT